MQERAQLIKKLQKESILRLRTHHLHLYGLHDSMRDVSERIHNGFAHTMAQMQAHSREVPSCKVCTVRENSHDSRKYAYMVPRVCISCILCFSVILLLIISFSVTYVCAVYPCVRSMFLLVQVNGLPITNVRNNHNTP